MTVAQDDRSALALSALAEVTEPSSVGELVQVDELEGGVRNLAFACRLPGYRDWRWIVSTAQVADADPTVLEVELLPADGALLAPPWVPWAERLAEYRRTHPDEAVGADEEDLDDADLDEEDLDEDDLDDADLDESDDVLELDGVEFEDPQDEDAEDQGLEDDEPAGPADDTEGEDPAAGHQPSRGERSTT